MGQGSTHLDSTEQLQDFAIPLWEYNREKHIWSQKQQGIDYGKSDWDRFRVVTYNLWISDKFQPMRFRGLCDILSKSKAQVIGLQEGLFFLLISITERTLVYLFSNTKNSSRTCGTTICSRTILCIRY
jgi:hypothetical protein